MNKAINVLIGAISTTDTSAPDDFLNLYPEDVPDNWEGLVETGFGFSPFLFAAVLIASLGAALLGVRHRRA